MKREDLGKMLEDRVMLSQVVSIGKSMFQAPAEGFWNDVIDALIERVDYFIGLCHECDTAGEVLTWLEDQKIKED